MGKGPPNLPSPIPGVNACRWIGLPGRTLPDNLLAAQPSSNPGKPTPGMPDRLRVLFITEDDPLYVIRLFEVFFREYSPETLDICGVTIDRPFHEPPWK